MSCLSQQWFTVLLTFNIPVLVHYQPELSVQHLHHHLQHILLLHLHLGLVLGFLGFLTSNSSLELKVYQEHVFFTVGDRARGIPGV